MSKEKGWLDWLDQGLDVAKLMVGATPVGAAITIIDAVVDEANKEHGIDNYALLDTIKAMSKSKWNSLTPEKIEKIKVILEEK